MYTEWTEEKLVEFYNRQLAFENEEIDRYLESLELRETDSLIDLGCGNGRLLKRASRLVASATGVDISGHQMELARREIEGIKNITLIESSFMDLDLNERTFNRGSARKSLHHLTDEEKHIFMKKIGPGFKKNALLKIEDAVFTFPKSELKSHREKIYQQAKIYYGERWEAIRDAFDETIFKEHPADMTTWSEALEQAGFRIVQSEHRTCFYGIILARRI